jgi:plasmid stability protein
MPITMIQIRSVPEDFHRRLKARAAIEGLSMSAFVLREVRRALDRPTRQEMLDRLRAQPVRRLRRRAADIVRVERDAR